MPSDVFRPRLPLDPFARIDHGVAWRIPAELQRSPPQVILVLGDPSASDLHALLQSTHLSHSLLLIATHTPLALPTCSTQGPAVRVLRLSAPLHVHDAGALRLVSLLERAQRVAALWRAHPENMAHVLHLAEETPNGEFTVLIDKATTTNNYPSPAPSFTSIKRHKSIKARFSTLSLSSSTSLTSSSSSNNSPSDSISRNANAKKSRRLSQITLSQLIKDSHKQAASSTHARGFDAIVNFLPTGLPEKALLKHAILVTTLSAQYLALPPGSGSEQQAYPYPYHYQRRSSISSASGSGSPPLPTPLSLPHLPSSSSPNSSAASASSLLSTPPPIAKIPAAKSYRRFSSFALPSAATSASSFASSSQTSIPSASARTSINNNNGTTPSESGELPAVRSGSSFSSYGLSAGSGSGTSTAVTTPATSPGCELSSDEAEAVSPFEDSANANAKTTAERRKSVKKRFSSLFASVASTSSSRPSSTYGMEMEMGVLGSSAKKERTRPRNAHLVHVLPADWSPYPQPHPLSHSHSHPHASSSSASASTSTSTPHVRSRTRHEKPKLVQGIEQFLLGFAYPLPSSSSSHSNSPSSRGLRASVPPSAYHRSQSRSQRPTSTGTLASLLAESEGGHGGEDGGEDTRAVPYLLAPGLFGKIIGGDRNREEGEDECESGEGDGKGEEDVVDKEEEDARSLSTHAHGAPPLSLTLTLGEAVLLGALDFNLNLGGRAWVGEGDVEVVGGGAVQQTKRKRTLKGKGKGRAKEEEEGLSAVVLAKELEGAQKAKAKEETMNLGLPTPPSSQRSSVTSSRAESAEGDVEAEVEEVQVQEPKERTITIPPRAMPSPSRSSSSSSSSSSDSGCGTGAGMHAHTHIPLMMSRSLSTGANGIGKKPHYVPARLVAQQQQQEKEGEKVKRPGAVHLLNGVEIDSNRTLGGVLLAAPPASESAPALATTTTTTTPQGKPKPKAPPLLREQTKAKVGARPASMVVLSAVGGKERERTKSQGGVFGLGSGMQSALRRMGLSAFAFGKEKAAVQREV